MGNPICNEHKPGALMIAVERDRISRITALGKKVYGRRKFWECTKCGRLKPR